MMFDAVDNRKRLEIKFIDCLTVMFSEDLGFLALPQLHNGKHEIFLIANFEKIKLWA